MKTPEELFNENIKLAYFAQRRYGWIFRGMRSVTPGDISQICLMALWFAALHFDSGRGLQFSTFAVSHMRGEMKKALRSEYKLARMKTVSIDGYRVDSNTDGHAIPQFDIEGPDNTDICAASVDAETFVSQQPERDRRIIACRQAGMTQAETAHAVGVSQVHVSRIVRTMARQYAAACGR